MGKGRLEAFSDGVLAIIITIMVLELRVPEGVTLEALAPVCPKFFAYAVSFVYVGIYWNNHHHMFHVVEQVNGLVLWANLHLLFWLSLFPFSTSWLDQTRFALTPTVLYGTNLLLAGIAYYVLEQAIFRTEGQGSRLRRALGADVKGKISPVLYLAGIGLAFVATWLAMAVYTVVG